MKLAKTADEYTKMLQQLINISNNHSKLYNYILDTIVPEFNNFIELSNHYENEGVLSFEDISPDMLILDLKTNQVAFVISTWDFNSSISVAYSSNGGITTDFWTYEENRFKEVVY